MTMAAKLELPLCEASVPDGEGATNCMPWMCAVEVTPTTERTQLLRGS
jgi:hypothetical protein